MKRYADIIDRLKSDAVKLTDLVWLHRLAAEVIDMLADRVDQQEREIMILKWDTTKKPLWHDAKVELPPDGEPVLVVIRENGRPVIACYHYSAKSPYKWSNYETDTPIVANVTHWTELPTYRKERTGGEA